MDWTCPGCGQIFKRERQPHKCVSGGCPELAFTGSKAKWLPLYLELFDAARARMQFNCVYPPSGGVIWRKRSAFSSMAAETGCLRVGFHSDQRMDCIDGVEIYPMSVNRLLHVIRLKDNERIGEVVDYIHASYILTEQDGR